MDSQNIELTIIIVLYEEEENLLLTTVDYLDSKKDYLINYFKIKSLEGTLLNTFENYLPAIN